MSAGPMPFWPWDVNPDLAQHLGFVAYDARLRRYPPVQPDLFPELLPRCAQCGEYWPCSDSRRRDLSPLVLAAHRMHLP